MYSGDQEKVNYLLVLRCQLASLGWVGSSGGRERNGREEKGEKKEVESPRLAQNDSMKCYSTQLKRNLEIRQRL